VDVVAPSELLQRAVRRVVMAGHEGKSGAGLEKVWLADGRALVVKRITPESDLTLALTGGDVSREVLLWQAGVFERLPDGITHALLDAWVEEDGTSVIVMRDLGPAMLTWQDRLSVAATHRVVDRVASLHREFLDEPPADLAPLAQALGLFAPQRIAPYADAGNELCVAARRGWDIFFHTAPYDVAGPVRVLLDDPERLAAAMAEGPLTLCHGDLATVNMAFVPDRLVLLDWAMPTVAPGALDIARFVAGCSSVVEPSREEVLAAYARAAGPAYDERSMRLALLAGLVWLGWNKALDAAEHPDPAIREREAQDLDWWVHEARTTLESGVI
jgi:thiamine kinase-like enzyme